MRRLLTLAAVAVVASSCAGGDSDDRGDVYRLTMEVTASGRVGPGVVGVTEWIDPAAGRWRSERVGRREIYDGASYARIERDGYAFPQLEVRVRTGSPSFLGPFLGPVTDGAVAGRAPSAYLAGKPETADTTVTRSADGKTQLRFFARPGGEVVATIEETLSREEADSRRLFAIPHRRATSSTTERPAGARAASGIRAYWLGRRAAGRTAVAAIEERTRRTPDEPPTVSHTVFYKLPSAEGQTSEHGWWVPPGEIRVSSEPAGTRDARSWVRHFNAGNADRGLPPSPRFRVRLANGEAATLFYDHKNQPYRGQRTFWVLTPSTLVTVNGLFSHGPVVELAKRLRPIR